MVRMILALLTVSNWAFQQVVVLASQNIVVHLNSVHLHLFSQLTFYLICPILVLHLQEVLYHCHPQALRTRGVKAHPWPSYPLTRTPRLNWSWLPWYVRITPSIPYFSLVFPYFFTSLDNCPFHFIIIPNHEHTFPLNPYLIFKQYVTGRQIIDCSPISQPWFNHIV